MSKPDHDAVVAAVSRAADAELLELMGDDAYVLRQRDVAGVEQWTVWQLLLTEVDHPMGVFVATRDGSDECVLLSGQPDNVWRVLRQEGAADAPAELPQRYWALVRDQTVRSRLLQAPAPAVERTRGAFQMTLAVGYDDRIEHWAVTLPLDDGEAARMTVTRQQNSAAHSAGGLR